MWTISIDESAGMATVSDEGNNRVTTLENERGTRTERQS